MRVTVHIYVRICAIAWAPLCTHVYVCERKKKERGKLVRRREKRLRETEESDRSVFAMCVCEREKEREKRFNEK